MRIAAIAAILITAVLALGARANQERIIELAPGQSVELVPGTTLRFDRVVGNSRCPADVDCIWAGEAKLQFTLARTGRPEQDFVLSTLDPKQVEIDGWFIRLAGLPPAPARGKKADYTAKLGASTRMR